MQDPEIQNILTDPVMRQVLFDLLIVILLSCRMSHVTRVHVGFLIPFLHVFQVLIDFQENPKAAQDHLKNPQVMHKIQKLVSAGIVQMR